MIHRSYARLQAATIAAFALLPAVLLGQSNSNFTLSQAIQDRVAKGDKPVIYVSYHDVSNEFAPFIKSGAEKAGKDFNVYVKLHGPFGAHDGKQVTKIESLIQKGVDGP